ncbi:AAA-domain-containing protein [Rickenella mellea]|uniref:AAA-domain-containing protein n=1 Tax=Rickenella mellea TaxID=50990 RepID=A0A4V3AZI7_9AGAM|nr:AAA-domain-containing protein [Rickenella mellea]
MNGDVPMAIAAQSQNMRPVHVEVRLSRHSKTSYDTITRRVQQRLLQDYTHIYMPSVITGWDDCNILKSNVERIIVAESSCSEHSLPVEHCAFQIHVYQPSEGQSYDRTTSSPSEPSEEVNGASVSELPSRELEGLWESLIYEDDVKSRLLNYIYATVGFSDAGVDHNLVSWNRVVLLHGPPGTGKTSLCRALAQKLSIRLGERYPHTRLLEINSHSLFSRWFSESGKLVQNLFSSVGDMIEDEEDFVVLLIDEVESLTAARAGAMAGTEPSDALRVVNALLTQLDKLKHKKNVLVLSTSNLAKAIDSAFVDRADIVQYIDVPPREAIYEIFRSCLMELVIKGIVSPVDVPTTEQASIFFKTSAHNYSDVIDTPESLTMAGLAVDDRSRSRQVGERLFALSTKCKGMSGRALRRLPVLAHAQYIGLFTSHSTTGPTSMKTNGVKPNGDSTRPRSKMIATQVEVWLDAMEKVVQSEVGSRTQLERT